MTSPILLTVFNRPDETRRVFDAIRDYAPKQLFIAADGPRSNRPGEAARCEEAVRVMGNIDWDCRVSHLIRTENLGCRRAMEEAIDWFFDSVPEGIILEDDCLPSADFFRFCDELLERYRDDDRIAMVSGTNVLGQWRPSEDSYIFGQGSIWGWASWRRAWLRSTDHLVGISSRQACRRAEQTLGRSRWRKLKPALLSVAAGELDTWDYPWVFALAARGQVSAVPAVNLVTNIGFGPEATHTISRGGAFDQIESQELEDPLRHPDRVAFDQEFEARCQALEAPDRWARLPPMVRSVARSLRDARMAGDRPLVHARDDASRFATEEVLGCSMTELASSEHRSGIAHIPPPSRTENTYVNGRAMRLIKPIQRLRAVGGDLRHLRLEVESAKLLLGHVLSELHRYSPPRESLQDYEFSVFSQWGEDGIIQHLINDIDVAHRTFIEFGVEDFSESNCHFLLEHDNWQGYVIDGSAVNIRKLRTTQMYWRRPLEARPAFVTRETVNGLLAESGMDRELGILSIDLDGVDYHILEALPDWRPSILIVEYNAVFGCELAVTVPYRPDFTRFAAHTSGLYYGASLRAFADLLEGRGYSLVGVNRVGCNAFFVRSDLCNDNVRPDVVENAFRDSTFHESRDASGALTLLRGKARREAIASLPLLDLRTGAQLRVRDLPDPARLQDAGSW